jgi:subtilisin family serine protease
VERGALIEVLSSLPERLLQPEALGDGAGVRVAVVDSGIDAAHPDLKAKVTRSVEVRMTAPDKLTMVDAEPADGAGHGTACADIIGRLAPGCELWNVRALGPDCKGSPKALGTALRWAIEQGADVINLSLGTRDPAMSDPLRALIDAAYRKNLLIVAAANNIPGVHSYPAVFTSLVCVDSDHFDDPEAFHFRFGELSEVVAPGVYIDAAWPGGGRKLVTGTSFATPHVSGHIARIVSANPGIRPFQVKSVLFAMGRLHAAKAAAAGGGA